MATIIDQGASAASTTRQLGQIICLPGAANGSNQKSEAGIGALMPWADGLYVNTYPANDNAGNGCGLWRVDKNLRPTLLVEHNCTHAGRIIYNNQLYMGHHVIDAAGNITAITGFDLTVDRIAAWASNNTVAPYALTMAGKIYQVNDATKVVTLVVDIAAALSMSASFTHGKAMWMHSGGDALYVAFNFQAPNGRLAQYQISTATTTSFDTSGNSWVEVGGSYENNSHIFAFGHDDLSLTMWTFQGIGTLNQTIKRKLRMPYASEQQRHAYQQEWMRLRSVETERYLLDLHGQFFQISNWLSSSADSYTNDFPLVEPIAKHLRTIPDFCFWNGFLVFAGNENTPLATSSTNKPQYPLGGQAQSGLLLTTLDALHTYGRPYGRGFWWKAASVASAQESDLMLRKGYGAGTVTLQNNTSTAVNVNINIYEDPTVKYVYKMVTVPANGAWVERDIPPGAWVSVTAVAACTSLSAWVNYVSF